jgi:hypothetical protein
MGRGSARRRLPWAIGMAALAAAISVGLLWAGQRGEEMSFGGGGGSARGIPAREALPALGGIDLVAPESGATLRGVVLVQAEWPNPTGYVMFRVDDAFAYATTPPYEMRWDTSTARDAEHVIQADAYDGVGSYVSSSSIRVMVENAIPAPQDGVLMMLRFSEDDLLTREVTARGELSALAADEALPQGFDVLVGQLRGDVSQSVLDPYYEGTSALVRNRIRTGYLTVEGARRSIPEAGQYAVVQISRNGLTIPATAAVSKPRLGLGEICVALPDYPVFPGDTWEAPLGVVCELYSRRAIFVQGRYVFEGLRWFRGRECAVVTSSYTIPEVPLLGAARTAGLPATGYEPRLTQMMGGRGERMMGGMMGRRGMMAGPRARGARGPTGQAPTAAGRAGAASRPAAAQAVGSARLVDLQGTRRTYVDREVGSVLQIQDTILGKLEFRAALGSASASGVTGYAVSLTQGMRGPMGMGMRGAMGGDRGMRGGMMGPRARGAAGARQRTGTAARRAPGAVAGAGRVPLRLEYGFELTTDLVAR